MNRTLHIARKDAHHIRWVLAGWAMLIVARVVLETNRASLELYGPASAIIASQLVSLVSFIELAAMAIVISLVVHEDPPAARDAFWLTRPFDPRSMAMAKVGLTLATLVLLPIAGDFVTLALSHARAGELLRAVVPMLIARLGTVLPLFVAAVLTTSLARFMLVIVAAAGAFVVFFAALTTSAVLFMKIEESSPGPQVISAAPGTVVNLAMIAVALSVTTYMYRYRRVKMAVAFTAAGLIVAVALPIVWPWRSTAPMPDPGPWARDEANSIAVVESVPPHLADRMAMYRRDRATKQIAAPIHLAGMPDDVSIQGVQTTSRFDVAGATLTSTRSEMTLVRREGVTSATGTARALQGALGNVDLSGRAGENDYEMWPVVLLVTDQELAQYGRTPGRLTADVTFHLQRQTVAQTSPLRLGEIFSTGAHRLEITRVERGADSCTLFLREVAIAPLFATQVYRSEEIVLRNRVKRQAVRGDQDWFGTDVHTPLSLFLNVTLGGFSGGGPSNQGFAIRNSSIRFPARNISGDRQILDAAWLADAEVVRVTAEYAGRLTRPVTVENFQMVR